jgi:hypothetical protein
MYRQKPIVAPLPGPERKVVWYEDAEMLLACGCDVVFANCLAIWTRSLNAANFSLPVHYPVCPK